MSDLDGTRAMVTGAAVGIGRAAATHLADRGARVLAVDYSRDVEQVPADVPAAVAERIETCVADLADRDALEELGRRLHADPPTDLLVNCAAAYPPAGGFLAAGFEDWDRVMRVNVTAMGMLSAALARGLSAAGRGGAIVNVDSLQEVLPVPGYGPYVTSKGAVQAGTRALAVELAPLNIRVNSVAPGVVNTPSTRNTLDGGLWGDESPPPTLLGRAGTAAEIARVIAFLASDAASFVTGAVLPADGGRSLSRRYDPLGVVEQR